MQLIIIALLLIDVKENQGFSIRSKGKIDIDENKNAAITSITKENCTIQCV